MSDPNQTLAADPARSVFVTANAGSGKTTTLVNRVARLLLQGSAPGEILCVTYTKAAAAEMQSRLFERLGDWAVADDLALARSLQELDPAAPPPTEGQLARARRLFARALETPGGLKIQTIHAFCETVLRRFPVEAGVAPDFEVLEDEAADLLSREARDELARRAGRDPESALGRAFAHFAVELAYGDFLDLLNLIEQRRLALHDYVARVDRGDSPDPWAVVGAEKDRGPADLERAFAATLDPAEWLRTAEALERGGATDAKRAARMRAAVPPNVTLDDLCAVTLKQDRTPPASLATKAVAAHAVAYLQGLQQGVLALLEAARAARVAEDTVRVLTLANAHSALYEEEKRRTGALDFGDLVALTRRLLTERVDAAWVLYKLDGGFRHVLVDEAQDTAPDQWDVLRALTGEFFAGHGAAPADRPRTMFAVGDEKQSIYSFQGARPERLRREAQAYDALVTGSGGVFQGVELGASYRSTPEVLAFVDEAFEPPGRVSALVGQDLAHIPPHAPTRLGQHGAVDLLPLFTDPDAVEPEAWTAPVDQESRWSGRKKLARALAESIRRQVADGVGVYDRKSGELRPCGYGDFLVLVRRRDPTFEEILRALKALGVPVAGADRLKLSQHAAFQDLIALARVALYPHDDLSVAEVLRSPFCDVPDFGPPDSLYELAEQSARGGRGLWSVLRERAGEQPSWTRARDLLAAARAARGGTAFAFFSRLLNRVDDTGLSGRARVLVRLGREAEEALDETLARALAVEDRGGLDLETALGLLETSDKEVKREMEGARGEVRVMTVHGAKGLEAPVVILPDTTVRAKPQGPTLLPLELGDAATGRSEEVWLMCPGRKDEDCRVSALARSAREARTEDESLRLLYVALTRARDRLVIMGKACKRPAVGFEDRSWWDVVSETFGRLGERVRDVGDGVLRFGPDPVVLAAAPANDALPAAEIPDWIRRSPRVERGSAFVAPSSVAGKAAAAALSPLAQAPAAGGAALGRFRRGDLIHRLLERLPDVAPADRPAAARRALARERDLSPEQAAEMIDAALGVLDDPTFAEVFGPGSRAEVALAGEIAALPGGALVSGRVDRLVVTPERVLVIDYKTNRPSPDSAEQADPAYLAQMATYVALLRQVFPGRRVEAALVWTDGPKLTPLSDSLVETTLAALGRVEAAPVESHMADLEQE